MAPVPALVAAAVTQAAPRGIINIFAGIPATVSGPMDLDAYCAKGCYFIGTSGSTLDDMLALKRKVEHGQPRLSGSTWPDRDARRPVTPNADPRPMGAQRHGGNGSSWFRSAMQHANLATRAS